MLLKSLWCLIPNELHKENCSLGYIKVDQWVYLCVLNSKLNEPFHWNFLARKWAWFLSAVRIKSYSSNSMNLKVFTSRSIVCCSCREAIVLQNKSGNHLMITVFSHSLSLSCFILQCSKQPDLRRSNMRRKKRCIWVKRGCCTCFMTLSVDLQSCVWCHLIPFGMRCLLFLMCNFCNGRGRNVPETQICPVKALKNRKDFLWRT